MVYVATVEFVDVIQFQSKCMHGFIVAIENLLAETNTKQPKQCCKVRSNAEDIHYRTLVYSIEVHS